MGHAPPSSSTAGIGFILLAMTAISINDMLIKQLSGGYPLHQMVFVRSVIAICFSFLILRFEGGLASLKTSLPWFHAARGALIVCSNLCFFTALAVLSLAEATALFFVAPLLITLLSVPLLGEKVGPFRLGAVVVGFFGILLMVQPWKTGGERDVALAVMLLPILGALFYALNNIITRRIGIASKASAMAIYVQLSFIAASALFYLIAGDGRFAQHTTNPAVQFLLRPWIWPQGSDRWLFLGLGVVSAVVAYALSQAYRLAEATTIAPFEYIGMPLAIFWGWLLFDEWPDFSVWAGIALIVGSGLFVFLRERRRKLVPLPRPPA